MAVFTTEKCLANLRKPYKNPGKPTCIDLILAICPPSFQNSCVIEIGLSDIHKFIATVMKTSYRKTRLKMIHYATCKDFSNDIFREPLQKIFPQSLVNSCDKDVEDFMTSCNKILDQYASLKKKHVRGNHSLFMNKNLSKAIMLRTKLRTFFSRIGLRKI